ncbi:HIT family protein [Erysipelothrix sp. HDW6C]|nr:HIT family protein [Erysipelothrix sp. HDW6C]
MNSCIFCNIPSENKLMETQNFYVLFDINPVQEGHLLIISKAHIMNVVNLDETMLLELGKLEQSLVTIIEANFDVLGVTLERNNGRTMMAGTHFHEHLIPRYPGDKFFDNQEIVKFELDTDRLKALIIEN